MSDLTEKNSRGLIRAPDEDDAAFTLRCLQAKKNSDTPHSHLAKKLFDIDPDWVEVRYSDENLRLWEGACTWIEPHKVTVQLRKAFETKSRFLGYAKEEIIAHELVHVVRSQFEEPIFEEMLAYQSSRRFFRRFFGPLFRNSKESLVFIGALSIACLATLFGSFQKLVYLGTVGFVAGGTLRLLRAQVRFTKARLRLAKVVGKERALAVMIRLTDREIIRFSHMEKEQIISYAIKMSRAHQRWKQIRAAYFPH